MVPAKTQPRRINLSRKTCPCPTCRTQSKRHSEGKRRLREVGITKPTTLEVTYSKHYCPTCRKHFAYPMEHFAVPGARFTRRVQRIAMDLYHRDGLTLERVTLRMRARHHVHVPPTTLCDWVAAGIP